MTGSRVVVGVDRSDSARAALQWAMAEAGRRDATLDVICAWMPAAVVSPIGMPATAMDPQPFEEAAKQTLDEVVAATPAALRRSVRDLQQIAVPAPPASALIEAAEGAELLVVGTRGLGLFGRMLGSVSHQVVHHSPCPVTVVPNGWPVQRWPARIVAGVDGSPGSAAALRWAIEEAARWDGELVVAHAWDTPYPVEPWGMVVTPRDEALFERGAIVMIDEMLDAARDEGVAIPATTTTRALHDAAGPALIEATKDADLLVVGSRGRGGFAALLLGSVSLHCLHHARCPVTIVNQRPPGR